MKLHELRPAPGSRKTRQRVGRGISSGQGKTSGRGQKGQKSRSSVGLPMGFEGGQLPLAQRMPKLRGFHNKFRKEYAIVNIGKLGTFGANSVVDLAAVIDAGLVARRSPRFKILGAGKLTVALTVRVDRVSKSARLAIEGAGGAVETLEPDRAPWTPKVKKAKKKVAETPAPSKVGSKGGAGAKAGKGAASKADAEDDERADADDATTAGGAPEATAGGDADLDGDTEE